MEQINIERINRFIRECSQKQWLEYRVLDDWKVFSTIYRQPGHYDEAQPYSGSESFGLFPSVQGTTYYFRTTRYPGGLDRCGHRADLPLRRRRAAACERSLAAGD